MRSYPPGRKKDKDGDFPKNKNKPSDLKPSKHNF